MVGRTVKSEQATNSCPAGCRTGISDIIGSLGGQTQKNGTTGEVASLEKCPLGETQPLRLSYPTPGSACEGGRQHTEYQAEGQRREARGW